MSKKYQSRSTKMILAALLAASMSLPVVASASETTGAVTTSAVTTVAANTETQINFTVADSTNEAARFIKGPGVVLEYAGQKYIKLNISDATAKMITAMTVDGKSAMSERNGTKAFSIPVSADYAAVTVKFTVDNPYTSKITEYEATLTPDASSVKEVELVETVLDQGLILNASTLADGIYTAKAKYLKPGSLDESTMKNYFSNDVVVKVKDGKATVEVTVVKDYAAILELNNGTDDAQVKGTVAYKTAEKHNKVFSLPTESIGAFNAATTKIDYSLSSAAASWPAGQNPINVHTIAIDVDAETLQTKGSIHAINASNNQPSIMNTYLSSATSIKAVKNGYEVEVSFPQGSYVHSFEVEGKPATLVQAHTEANPTSIYKFTVGSISEVLDAKIHVIVPGFYNENHDVKLQLSAKAAAPFADVKENVWSATFINELYAKGIFAQDTKFNPANVTQRYQFALMLQRAFNFEVPATSSFTDLPSSEEAVSAIKALAAQEIIKGTGGTSFSPNKGISRQDAAIMIHRLLVANGYVDAEGVTNPFKDIKVTDTSSAYEKEVYNAVTQLADMNIFSGNPDGTFAPKQQLTREQMAKVLSIALEVINVQKNK